MRKKIPVTIQELRSPKLGIKPTSYVIEAVLGMAIIGPMHRHVMEMMINEGMRPSFSVMPDAPWPIRADAMMAIRLIPISIAI